MVSIKEKLKIAIKQSYTFSSAEKEELCRHLDDFSGQDREKLMQLLAKAKILQKSISGLKAEWEGCIEDFVQNTIPSIKMISKAAKRLPKL